MRASAPTPASRHERIFYLAIVFLVVAACWAALAAMPSHGSLLEPHTAAPSAGGLGAGFALWMIMMMAMMLPSATPWILAVGAAGHSHRNGIFLIGAFGTGYFSVWGLYSFAAALTQVYLLQQGLVGDEGRLLPVAAAIVLIAAGLFQWSPLKSACLSHCRSPAAYLLRYWRAGLSGAFSMGLRHGAFCFGCCWALMALALVLGVMSLLWMAGLTVVLCIEKLAPYGAAVGRVVGLVLVGWGLWLLYPVALTP